MDKYVNAKNELERRMQESGMFDDISNLSSYENFKEKLDLFLENETPEQAVKDLEIIEDVIKKAESERLQLELEAYESYATDTRVLTAVAKFMEADMKDRDAALLEAIRVLNNAKNKYDIMKKLEKIKKR